MLVLIPCLLLFLILALAWLIAAALLVGLAAAQAPRAIGKVLDHGKEDCACFLVFSGVSTFKIFRAFLVVQSNQEGLRARRLMRKLHAWLTSPKGLPQILNFLRYSAPVPRALRHSASPLRFRCSSSAILQSSRLVLGDRSSGARIGEPAGPHGRAEIGGRAGPCVEG